MNGFTHLGRRGGPFAPSLKLGRGVFCNRSGSGLFRRDGLPPFPRVCNFTQLVAEEFNTGARIFVGGVEAAQRVLAPGAETNITFVVDCRRDQGLGRFGFCVTASCRPPRDAALPLVTQGPNRNYIKVAATRLAEGGRNADASGRLTEQEYDLLTKVPLCIGSAGL